MSKVKTIYIAGPDIFAPNGKEIGEHHKAICEQFGFKGIYPLDGSSVTATKSIDTRKVFYACLASIQRANIVVANLNPFRGECVDDGTAFEMGVAFRMEKPIYGYLSDKRSIIERHHGATTDERGWSYEDFGNPVNIMLAQACEDIIEGSFEDCIRSLQLLTLPAGDN